MKRGLLILIGSLIAAGCQSGASRPLTTAAEPPVFAVRNAEVADATPSGAAALVFDPPVAYGAPSLDLSRAGREPAAFWGYDQGSVSTSYTYSADRQIDFGFNGIQREAITARTGSLSR